jgi:neutral ceramidase
VDYALRVKREYPGENIIVAGYSNDVMCYIPSLRVLKEGGYEADTSMMYYGQPGPFNEEVEEVIFGGIHQVMKRVGRKPAR